MSRDETEGGGAAEWAVTLPPHVGVPAPTSFLATISAPPLAGVDPALSIASRAHDSKSAAAASSASKPVTFHARIRSSGYGFVAPRKPSWATPAAAKPPAPAAAGAPDAPAGRWYDAVAADETWHLRRSWLPGGPARASSATSIKRAGGEADGGKTWREAFPSAAAAVAVHCHPSSGALIVGTADGTLAALPGRTSAGATCTPLHDITAAANPSRARWIATGKPQLGGMAVSSALYAGVGMSLPRAGAGGKLSSAAVDVPAALVLSWSDGPLAAIHAVGAAAAPSAPWLVLDTATDGTTAACGGNMTQSWRAAAFIQDATAAPSKGVAGTAAGALGGSVTRLPDAVATAKTVSCGTFFHGDRFVVLGAGNGLHAHRFTLDREWGSASPSAAGGGVGDVEALKRRRHNGSSFARAAWWAACSDGSAVTAVAAQNSARSSLVWCTGSDKSLSVYDCGRGAEAGLVSTWLHASAHARGAHAVTVPQPSPLFDAAGTAAADSMWYVAATVSRDGTVAVWDMRVGDGPVRKWAGGPQSVRVHPCGCAFSPDSRFLAVASEDRSVYVMDVWGGATGRARGAPDVVLSVTWHPTTAALFAGCLDGSVVMVIPDLGP